MLGLEAQQLTSPSAFQGLKQLTDHGLKKADWLERCPPLEQASQCLLKGTDHLNRLGQHLQVLTKTIKMVCALEQTLAGLFQGRTAFQPVGFLQAVVGQLLQPLKS